MKAENRSDDPGIAVYRGIGIPPALKDFGWETKRRLVTMEEVNAKAKENGVEFIDILGEKAGRIGALAAVALSEEKGGCGGTVQGQGPDADQDVMSTGLGTTSGIAIVAAQSKSCPHRPGRRQRVRRKDHSRCRRGGGERLCRRNAGQQGTL